MKRILSALCAVSLALGLTLTSAAFAADSDAASVDGVGYATVQAAIDNANGKTVVLLRDVTESVTIPAGTTVTLDLADKTLTNAAGQHTITNNGTLTITGTGTVDNVSHGRGALVNGGTVTMQGGTLTRSAEASTSPTDNGGNSWYVVDNNGGTFTMAGGAIENVSKYSSLIRNLDATFYMQGGRLENDFITLKNDDNGVIGMTGGTVVTNAAGGSAIQNWGDLTVSGGELVAAEGAAALYALTWTTDYHSSAVIEDGAKISGDIQINVDSSYADTEEIPAVTIEGGDIDGSIAVRQKGSLTVNGGSISGAITAQDAQKVEVNGGAFAVQPDDGFISDDSAVVQYSTAGAADVFFIGTQAQIASSLSGLKSGDTVAVLQGDVQIEAPDGVTVRNEGDGSVTVNDAALATGEEVTVHVHAAVKVEAKEATATEDGNIEYWYCEGCGKYFRDAALQEEMQQADTVIPATGEPQTPPTGVGHAALWSLAAVMLAGGAFGVALWARKRAR